MENPEDIIIRRARGKFSTICLQNHAWKTSSTTFFLLKLDYVVVVKLNLFNERITLYSQYKNIEKA